jgi:hypothetical protein
VKQPCRNIKKWRFWGPPIKKVIIQAKVLCHFLAIYTPEKAIKKVPGA